MSEIVQKKHDFSRFIDGSNLNLSQQNLTDVDVSSIVYFLRDFPNITSLDLSFNHIGDQGLEDFVERNLGVCEVNFRGNNISDRGLAVFTYLNHIITQVDFSYNLISEKGISQFTSKNQTCFSCKFSVLRYH